MRIRGEWIGVRFSRILELGEECLDVFQAQKSILQEGLHTFFAIFDADLADTGLTLCMSDSAKDASSGVVSYILDGRS